MPLDAARSPKSVTATLNYLVRSERKPVFYVGEPPPGMTPYDGIPDPREVDVEDARGREDEFTLDRNGFALVQEPTRARDFYSAEEVTSVYYPEVQRLLKEHIGASRVFIFDHTIRNAARPDVRGPVRLVHNDQTANSAARRVRNHLGEDADRLLRDRFGILNVWRAIRGPVLDSPLALADARTVSDDDLIAADLIYPHMRGETWRAEYKPSHRWYYFSEQQPDEALLIRVHDSADDGRARLSIHTSFENPLATGAPPRESIEVRALVFFPPET